MDEAIKTFFCLNLFAFDHFAIRLLLPLSRCTYSFLFVHLKKYEQHFHLNSRSSIFEMAEVNFVGVDVGTGSVRAALVGKTGVVHKVHFKETKTWNPAPDHYEQSSDNIWSCICECVQVNTNRSHSREIFGIESLCFVFIRYSSRL